MAEKEKGLTKFITSHGAIISVLITLITAIITANYQFAENRRKSSDENFRSIVKMLSSENKEERLAAASNMGTFIEKGSYWPFISKRSGGDNSDDAIDILTNRTSVELDYNVLNAIRGGLKKAGKKHYGNIVENLLAIDRNYFIQEYAIEERKKAFDITLAQIETEYINREKLYKEGHLEVDRLYLDNLRGELKVRQEDYFKNQSYRNELKMHDQLISDFLSVFLGERDSSEPLKFFRNSMNNVVLADLDLSNSIFKRSSISTSTISETKFDYSKIIDTVFTYSNLEKSSFVGCEINASLFDRITNLKGVKFFATEFNDTFFTGSDLTGADFQGVKAGLQPVHFYEAINIEKAKFDDKLKTEIKEKKITEDDFIEYVTEKSELSNQRKEALLQSLDELRNRLAYFINASGVYASNDKEDARLAARAAWIIASENTKASMSAELSKLKNDLKKLKGKELDIIKLSNFEEELKGLKRIMKDIKATKEKLFTINRKYLDALEQGNANIFGSEYPKLFEMLKELKVS